MSQAQFQIIKVDTLPQEERSQLPIPEVLLGIVISSTKTEWKRSEIKE